MARPLHPQWRRWSPLARTCITVAAVQQPWDTFVDFYLSFTIREEKKGWSWRVRSDRSKHDFNEPGCFSLPFLFLFHLWGFCNKNLYFFYRIMIPETIIRISVFF